MKPIVGGELVEVDGALCVVAKDGTYRSLNTSAYRGLSTIAANAATGREWGTKGVLSVRAGTILVTLIQPPRKDKASIRAAVLRGIIATGTDGEYLAACQRLHASRAEKSLAERVRALRGVGMRSEGDWDVRRFVGVQVQEMRTR